MKCAIKMHYISNIAICLSKGKIKWKYSNQVKVQFSKSIFYYLLSMDSNDNLLLTLLLQVSL